MTFTETLKEKVINDGYEVTRDDAITLQSESLEVLCDAANEIRKRFCGDDFDFCAIINAKSGHCTEDCKFCAQSSHYQTDAPNYPLMEESIILSDAKKKENALIPRYSLVTSGRNLSDKEVDKICKIICTLKKETRLSVCLSGGLLSGEQFRRLKDAGLTRFHNNLETYRTNFSNVCTTHTYDDKIAALKSALQAGLEVCSGGIMGLGETMADRIDMCLDLRSLGVKSIPLNVLSAIKGTPFEHLPKLANDEFCRIVAIFRFINPPSYIRLAGGRSVLGDDGERAFRSGANAAITDDMLTTQGIKSSKDFAYVRRLRFNPHKFI